MRRKRTLKDYSRIIAKEERLKERDVRNLLMLGWMNIIRAMEKGEEVRVKGFGRIYFGKTTKNGRRREEERNAGSNRIDLDNLLGQSKRKGSPWDDF